MPDSLPIQPVVWTDEGVVLIDQTALPRQLVELVCKKSDEVVAAIGNLVVRGAPAIGVAGAYAVVLAAREALSLPERGRISYFENALRSIEAARPTAVNLSWAVRRMGRVWTRWDRGINAHIIGQLLEESLAIHRRDIEWSRKISEWGSALLPCGNSMTYCNAGALATGGIGTALGVIGQAFRMGKIPKVFACETRPVLQGLRLTAWELNHQNIPYSVICDNMIATVLRSGRVSSIVVGADRIAANGDVANKIGTYGLAVLAKHHSVPFFVAAPSSSFDLNAATGQDIPIEERPSEEIISVLGANRPPFEVPVFNPAFDVTPADLIEGIICEKGVASRPVSIEKIQHLTT